jgi:hypothetical protein
MKQGPAKETIQIAVLDSVLYGAARAFEYLGKRGQGMLDRIGDGIVEYCTRNGYLDESADFEELRDRLTNFFEENGYFRVDVIGEGDTVAYSYRDYRYRKLETKLRQKGNKLLACTWCIADDALTRRRGRSPSGAGQTSGLVFVSDVELPDGFISRYRATGLRKTQEIESRIRMHQGAKVKGRIPPEKVGLPAFEAVEYGLARGFEYLGAQAQLFLDDLADGIMEFLREEFRLSLSKNPKQALGSLASFFASRGLADRIGVNLSPSTLDVVFTNYRYASVLRQSLDDGINLVSCPFTLATRTILRGDGLAAEKMKWKIEDNRKVVLTSQLVRIEDQEFDEDRVARAMDSIPRT